MSMILLDHGWQELAHHPEMRYGIHLESLLYHLLVAPQYSLPGADARIVDQNCGISMISSDLCAYGGDLRTRGYVGLVEKYVGS